MPVWLRHAIAICGIAGTAAAILSLAYSCGALPPRSPGLALSGQSRDQLRVTHAAALIDRGRADTRAIARQNRSEIGQLRTGAITDRSAWRHSAGHAARTGNRQPPACAARRRSLPT